MKLLFKLLFIKNTKKNLEISLSSLMFVLNELPQNWES